jgi:glycosyltransferase involved in cell wall biosynthesis
LKISIITISYNSARHIEQTIRSVVSQTYPDKEYIVIDGGSTDGTIEIINRYADSIDKWVSEPDGGISDAMNKGVALATGDFVIFLHADDYFVDDDSLAVAAKHLSNDHDVFIYKVIQAWDHRRQLSGNRPLGRSTNFKLNSCHQGHICSRQLFATVGRFDTDFRICMDYDFMLRAYRRGARSLPVDVPLAVMRMNGISSRLEWEGVKERIDEERRAHLKSCPSAAMRLIYRLYWLLYPAFKYCRSKRCFHRENCKPSSKPSGASS